ncbi:MAG TPA: hypothetical protein VEA80_05965 [Vitreimonas sp.]|uniref:hypothetical protein n=1 Tax=Vitreimonas sp. TaxID=3069702 RepID=UPI002D4A29C2|nr:hypothetical protein [Vitreimonas sp.]HYD86998.1 hypothetical protein [Vitreimonas sp.]
MSAVRLRFDPIDAEFVNVGDQRRNDRRGGERRAARAKLDTLFAATLVNHVTAAERVCVSGYDAAPPLRAGVVVNVRA